MNARRVKIAPAASEAKAASQAEIGLIPSPENQAVINILPSHREEINSTIDPELLEICAEFSADKRQYLAKKLRRWASDLERTAALLAWFENHNPNTPWHAAN